MACTLRMAGAQLRGRKALPAPRRSRDTQSWVYPSAPLCAYFIGAPLPLDATERALAGCFLCSVVSPSSQLRAQLPALPALLCSRPQGFLVLVLPPSLPFWTGTSALGTPQSERTVFRRTPGLSSRFASKGSEAETQSTVALPVTRTIADVAES